LVKQKIIDDLSKILSLDFFFDVPGKTDFGDLDIIYINSSEINIIDLLNEYYNPVDIVINGDVISWAFDLSIMGIGIDENRYFQVDFIKCPNTDKIPMYKFYFSYGDLGSIIGRITNYYGLKFGQEGLWVNLMKTTVDSYLEMNKDSSTSTTMTKIDQTQVTIRIYLSHDPSKICEYLDLDYSKWLDGFENKLQIFEWIGSTKLFDKTIFQTLNYEHRKRFSLRPFYGEFVRYIGIDSTDIVNCLPELSHSGEIGINSQLEAIKYFSKLDIIDNEINQLRIKQNRSEKFNGRMIVQKMKELNIKGNDKIGQHIKQFNEYISYKYPSFQSFNDYLDSASITIDIIKLDIDQYFGSL